MNHDIDISYVATNIANLTGVPVRLYEDGEKTLFHFVSSFPIDPILPHEKEVLRAEGHVSYYLADRFFYYGILTFPEGKIVVGPTRQNETSEQELRDLSFELGIPSALTEDFISAMNSIVCLPLPPLLQILCVTNYILNEGEKLSLEDVQITESVQRSIENKIQRQETSDALSESRQENLSAYAVEQTMLSLVQKGETAQLKEYFRRIPTARSGIPSSDYIRHVKDTFVVVATLVSRAAIRGGLNPDESLSLSSSYIGECEAEQSIDAVTNLQYRMVIDYAERVETLAIKEGYSQLIIDAIGYIQRNLSAPLTTQEIAKNLYVSRSYLSTRFKLETGEALYRYITKAKTKEAKRLLRYSDKGLSLIASHLGFSSQSHFARVFKTITGMTPLEYRGRF